MVLSALDYGIIVAFLVFSLIIGLVASKSASRNSKEFFLSGRKMPWWLLGISMVATTFSADTPNLVTDIVRKNGVAGNWVWWAFLLTGMTTVFIYAKLWRRSGISTDLEFYELRYSGGGARFLRAFRSLYLGVFFNVMIMATVLLAGIKIAAVVLGLGAIQTVLIVSLVTVSYAALGGLKGVILTDFFQFILSMVGMVAAACVIVGHPEIGGLETMISHPNVRTNINLLPDLGDKALVVQLLLIPLAVQWWSSWYPGAEPGGGGYVAQRMLSAKDEKEATLATLLFNVAHYALRPWPWILIALASLIVFPDLDQIRQNFPSIDPAIVQDDLAFPAMFSLLPQGLLGLVLASLIAALMSTISTHLNWGSSYIVHDFYARFIDREATERKKIRIARWSTILLMLLAGVVALYLKNALQAFQILLQIGAGTGLIFLLRWFWWRINAYSEISAMVGSFLIAIYFEFFYHGTWEAHEKMLAGVVLSSVIWIITTFCTPATDERVLMNFYSKIRPYPYLGWKKMIEKVHIQQQVPASQLPQEILMAFIACILVYAMLFATGYLLYGWYYLATTAFVIVLLCILFLYRLWYFSRSSISSKKA